MFSYCSHIYNGKVALVMPLSLSICISYREQKLKWTWTERISVNVPINADVENGTAKKGFLGSTKYFYYEIRR